MVEKTNNTETKKKLKEKLKQIQWKETAVEFTGLLARGFLLGIASACGAKSVTFHAAYFMKQEPAKVYETVNGEQRIAIETKPNPIKGEGVVEVETFQKKQKQLQRKTDETRDKPNNRSGGVWRQGFTFNRCEVT